MDFNKFKFWNRNRITDPQGVYVPSYESIGNGSAEYLDMTDLMQVYHTIPHIKCAINTLASMTANGIFKVLDKNGDEVQNHPLTLLMNQPNFLQHSKSFVMNYNINKRVYGNAFLYANRSSFGINSLFALPTESVKIDFTNKLYDQTEMSGLIKSIKVNEKDYDINEIIFLKENDDKLILGESKIKTLKQQISNIKHAYDSRNINITQRGPSGILTTGNTVGKDGILLNTMTPKEKKAAEDQLRQNYGIGKGQNSTLVTSANVDFISMSYDTSKLMLFEEIEDCSRVILDTFGLNDNLFSKVKSSTFNNVDASLERAYNDTVIPDAQIDASQIGRQSGMLKDGETGYMDFSHLPFLQKDEKIKAETIKIQLDSIEKAIALNLITEQEAKQIYNEKKLF